MAAIITGDILSDAVANLQAALDSQKTTWGVSQVYDYAAQEVGVRGDAIAIEVTSWQPQLIQQASPSVELAHKVGMRVWYITAAIRADVAFEKILSKLSKIVVYLIENPRPNGYGELLIDDQAFGPTIEAVQGIESGAGQLLAGKFNLVHTYYKAHTQTFA
jgi:hypothetical protein